MGKKQRAEHVDQARPVAAAPEKVTVRVPHPTGLRAVSVSGGIYSAADETVTVPGFDGSATLTLYY